MTTILSEIKNEVQTVMPPRDERWSKSSVQSMVKTDSILRESMRYSTFMTGALQRTVGAPEGVTTPDGLHIKRGNVVGIPALPVHRDPKTYHDPYTFEPLRFLRRSGHDQQQQSDEQAKVRSTNTVDTSLIFLPFGHGRHGCPGRFFAANEIKLLLAYIALNYEIQPLESRPEPIAFGSIMTPSPNISIKVRRRSA